MKKNQILFIAIVALMSACNFIDEEYSVIPSECQPHVTEFFRIAKEKGFQLYPDRLKIYYVSFDDENDLREANATPSQEIIRIDTSKIFWKQNPEALLFHELGHVYLGRDHDDEQYGMATKSIMNSSWLPSYGKTNFIPFPEGSREYYINELFNPNEPRPDFF